MRPYFYSLSEYIKDTYNTKMYKLALNGCMTCPNRDGLIDTRGCIFCSAGGSGEFAETISVASKTDAALIKEEITKQIDAAKERVAEKYSGNDYIAYFQAFSNTYGDIEYLKNLYRVVVDSPDVRILSIATRPDCLPDEVIDLIDELNKIKPVWIELGLQTIKEESVEYIRRGYANEVFDEAVEKLNRIGIKPIVHLIIGLPGESKADILNSVRYIANDRISGVKFSLLHILEGTDLCADYRAGKFQELSLEGYMEILGEAIEILPPNMVVHRITGDGPKNILVAPKWSANKKYVLNTINKHFKTQGIQQGRYYKGGK